MYLIALYATTEVNHITFYTLFYINLNYRYPSISFQQSIMYVPPNKEASYESKFRSRPYCVTTIGQTGRHGDYPGSDQTSIFHLPLVPSLLSSPLHLDGLSQREKLHGSNSLQVKWAPWLRAVHRPL